MIAEYALEPEMVATWSDRKDAKFIINQFGIAQGRLVSRYPYKWRRKVWDSSTGASEMEKKNLTELLNHLADANPMIKRKDIIWSEKQSWLENAVQENARYPFRAILARDNPEARPEILCVDDLWAAPCLARWNNTHGIFVNRQASEMVAAVREMLACCNWVKFIDPHLSPSKLFYQRSLRAFLNALATKRPVGPPRSIEIHTGRHGATVDFLRDAFQGLIPEGLQVTFYQWQERPGGQGLHNRYILTDLGGVSFQHGLDTGDDGETDDLSRLDLDQYQFRCKQYNPTSPAFDQAEDPFTISGCAEMVFT